MTLKNLVTSGLSISQVRQDVVITDDEPEPVPAVIEWLARLRLLEGVPFAYLVPHDEMLPPESIRFFYVDRNWLDTAVEGALSVGAVTSRDRAHLQTRYPSVRNAVDRAERRLWAARVRTDVFDGEAEVMTGFLLRSRAVSGWPGLHVNGFRGDDPGPHNMDSSRISQVRMERLAPAVLLVMFDGVPDVVTIDEPRQGIQYGVERRPPDEQPGDTRWIKGRNARSGELINTDGDPLEQNGQIVGQPAWVQVPFREGSPGVIHFVELRRRIRQMQQDTGQPADAVSSAELGMQMLQFPFRQFFGETEALPSVVFAASLPVSILDLSHHQP